MEDSKLNLYKFHHNVNEPVKEGEGIFLQKTSKINLNSSEKELLDKIYICGADLIVPNCSGWDFRNGDAQYLSGIEDETFDS